MKAAANVFCKTAKPLLLIKYRLAIGSVSYPVCDQVPHKFTVRGNVRAQNCPAHQGWLVLTPGTWPVGAAQEEDALAPSHPPSSGPPGGCGHAKARHPLGRRAAAPCTNVSDFRSRQQQIKQKDASTGPCLGAVHSCYFATFALSYSRFLFLGVSREVTSSMCTHA